MTSKFASYRKWILIFNAFSINKRKNQAVVFLVQVCSFKFLYLTLISSYRASKIKIAYWDQYTLIKKSYIMVGRVYKSLVNKIVRVLSTLPIKRIGAANADL